jgi:hypothetical protein
MKIKIFYLIRNMDEARAIFGEAFNFDEIDYNELNEEMDDEDEDEIEDEEEEEVEPEYDDDGNIIEDVKKQNKNEKKKIFFDFEFLGNNSKKTTKT